MPADPEQSQQRGHLCNGFVDCPKKVGQVRWFVSALEIVLLSFIDKY